MIENQLANAFKVALTGGIGSGKSAAAREFERLGIPVIDSDAIAHQITGPNGIAIPKIKEVFGIEFINHDGSLNRAKMRALVFDHPPEKIKLEKITHPLIRQEGERAALIALDSNPAYLIFMIPLLFESDQWRNKYDQIVVVDCPESLQIDRVIQRNGLAKNEIEKIIASQTPRTERLAHANLVIDNSASMNELAKQVHITHKKILHAISEKRV